MANKVLEAMSGGVDSSVALMRVVKMGYSAIGITMNLWEYKDVGGNTLDDSKDSLTKNKTNSISIEEPKVSGSMSRVDVGQIYEVGNRDLLLEVEAKSGQIIGSKLINFKKSMGAEESLEILGDVAGNAYLANSGFTTSQGYMEPDFNNKEIRN